MGEIDLDPASCAFPAQQVVRATTFYTKEQNGLTLPWRGRVRAEPHLIMVTPAYSSASWSMNIAPVA